ncbi:hypothetical protein N1851_015375 [Merluccius polli]|uniref:Uncharacterized protein n=1 Tax=Merluccius polli TaxID=89951 RepID=A0AA47P294_MERPO|nr:hypothetical protein N1851_015375 [Merluccius polli]
MEANIVPEDDVYGKISWPRNLLVVVICWPSIQEGEETLSVVGTKFSMPVEKPSRTHGSAESDVSSTLAGHINDSSPSYDVTASPPPFCEVEASLIHKYKFMGSGHGLQLEHPLWKQIAFSGNERVSLEKELQGNIDETVEEDLLEIFSRMGSHFLPSKDKLRAAILRFAHKALIQEPKFIIDCFHSSIHNAVPTLITKDSIMELYESKRPTNKKVAQMIKPSTESLNAQEQTALNHLLSSYPEFRKESDNVLSGDCFTMDIL